MRYLPSYRYPPGREGYWSPVTSTINWCEEDYLLTSYSAEVVNTLSNVLFLFLGVKGIRNCLKYGHDRIFLTSFVGYLLVGSGSFMFHSSLKYPMQLVDELSMIYTTCLMCYACFSFNHSRMYSNILGTSLCSLAIFITMYYHYLQDPKFHQNAFAFLAAAVFFKSIYVMEMNLRPSLRTECGIINPNEVPRVALKKDHAANARRDRKILRHMWWMIGIGLSVFLGGFGIWTLDNKYCSTLIRWRHNVGLPWGILLEGHGWWHLMTGIGAYFQLVWGIWLRHCLNKRQEEYELSWPSLFAFPEIVSAEEFDSRNRRARGKLFTKAGKYSLKRQN